MNSLVSSLTEISTGYSVFQKDQVLTEAQLNSVTDYLDDQDRLSRVNLTGVGILCGLRVSLAGNRITLSKGIGITTDGDLMRIAGAESFNRFKLYDNQFPAYAGLYSDPNTMFKAYELLPSGQTDAQARGLAQFRTSTGQVLREMFVILLMESYIQTHDLCTGADCDNHSQKYVGKIKLLLVEKAALSKLQPKIQTADQAARSLGGIVAHRALVAANTNNLTDLVKPYRPACKSMHDQLQTQFRKFWPACGFLLSETFKQDPTPSWVSRLSAVRNAFTSNQSRVQYYYDFLRDLVDTWNEMRDHLFGENSWCCPDVNGFPKHLLLGGLAPGPEAGETRLSFYPSAAVNSDRRLRRGIFLAGKIEVLLTAFNDTNPAAFPARVTVTPSYSAAISLSERAIPCYFKIDSKIQLVKKWNHDLSLRGEERQNYSCNHAAYGAQGAAAEPLNSAIDGNDFFRIEGHLGRNVTAVQKSIEDLIRQFNLPFSVCSVLVGTQRKDLVIKPFPIYTDLNRFHYMIRQDLAQKMDEVTTFSNKFELKLSKAIQDGIVRDDSSTNDGSSVKALARNKNRDVQKKALAARGKLDRDYKSFAKDKSWMKDIGETMVAASQFKMQLNKVVNTSFPTSFDSLIGNPTLKWLPWLDKFLEDKNSRAEEKSLFATFLAEHPGLEHTGGVSRGGIFVLVYQKGGKVVADFMLSHCCEKEIETPPAEPPLFIPQFPIQEVVEGGIRINPSRDNFVTERLDVLKLDIDERWTPKLNLQMTHNTALTGLLDVMKTRVTEPRLTIPPGLSTTRPDFGIVKPTDGDAGISGVLRPGRNQLFKDEVLGIATERVRNETEIINVLTDKIENPEIKPEVKRELVKERDKTETKLRNRIVEVTAHLGRSNPEADFGSEAHDSLEVVAAGMSVIKEPDRQKETREAVAALSADTNKRKSLRISAGNVLRLRG